MLDFMLKYIIFPWPEHTADTVITAISVVILCCVVVGLYVGIKKDNKGIRNDYFNAYFFAAIINYSICEVFLYWYIALPSIVVATAMLLKLMNDEAKEGYYAATHGMTYKQLKELWFENEDRYAETIDIIEKTKVDKEELKAYKISSNCLKLGFIIVTCIVVLTAIFTGGYDFGIF